MDKKCFKIGDKVRVVYINTTPHWENGYKLIDQTGVVINLVDNSIPIVVRFDTKMLESIIEVPPKRGYYRFRENEIEHVIKIGQQLEFSFMKGN